MNLIFLMLGKTFQALKNNQFSPSYNGLFFLASMIKEAAQPWSEHTHAQSTPRRGIDRQYFAQNSWRPTVCPRREGPECAHEGRLLPALESRGGTEGVEAETGKPVLLSQHTLWREMSQKVLKMVTSFLRPVSCIHSCIHSFIPLLAKLNHFPRNIN